MDFANKIILLYLCIQEVKQARLSQASKECWRALDASTSKFDAQNVETDKY